MPLFAVLRLVAVAVASFLQLKLSANRIDEARAIPRV